MTVAVFSDVHGNIYALEAVIRHLKSRRPDAVVFLGDIAATGLYPSECIALLSELHPAIWLKGNTDAWPEEPEPEGQPADEREEFLRAAWRFLCASLSPANAALLAGLPRTGVLSFGRIEVRFYHGSPVSFSDPVLAEMTEAELAEKFHGVECDVAAVGHTHRRMRLRSGGIEAVNPGAVGYPLDRDLRAGYGILSLGEPVWRWEQVNVEYPVESYRADLYATRHGFERRLLDFLS